MHCARGCCLHMHLHLLASLIGQQEDHQGGQEDRSFPCAQICAEGLSADLWFHTLRRQHLGPSEGNRAHASITDVLGAGQFDGCARTHPGLVTTAKVAPSLASLHPLFDALSLSLEAGSCIPLPVIPQMFCQLCNSQTWHNLWIYEGPREV